MPLVDKKPWWCSDEIYVDNDTKGDQPVNNSKDYIWFKPRYNGSWFTLDEAYDYFHEKIDKDALRRLRRLEEQVIDSSNIRTSITST